jgi:hypothetical protein
VVTAPAIFPDGPPGREQAERFFEWAALHPADWIEKVLRCRLWWRQRQACDLLLLNERVCIASGHNQGKDYLAGRIALWFLHTYPHSIVITTGPNNRQIKNIIWSENYRRPWYDNVDNVREIYAAWHAAEQLNGDDAPGEPLVMEHRVTDGWYAIGFKPQDYRAERFSGFHSQYILIIVTEASGVVDQALWDGVEGLLSAGFARLLEVGNPRDPESQYGRHFDSPEYAKIFFSAWECPNVQTAKWARKGEIMTSEDFMRGLEPDELVEKGRNVFPGMCAWDWPWTRLGEWGHRDPRYLVQVKGQFSETSTYSIITRAMLYQAKQYEMETYENDLSVLAVDPARYGDDETGFTYRIGPCAMNTWEYAGINPTDTANRIAYWVRTGTVDHPGGPQDFPPPDEVRIDCDGMGVGTKDRLVELRDSGDFPESIRLIEIHSSGPAIFEPEKYDDRRTEIWFRSADKFEAGEMDISRLDDRELERELRAPKYGYVSGRRKIEKKEKTKALLGRSPDKADSFVYAFCDVYTSVGDMMWG